MKNPFSVLFDRRAEDAIGSSYALAKYLLSGVRNAAGQPVTESTALSVSAVYACIDIRQRALSTLPLKVFERIDEKNKRPAVNHPLTRVINKPNGWQTRAEFTGLLETHRCFRGNAYAWINRATARTGFSEVEELIPLHPDQVQVLAPRVVGGPLRYVYRTKDGQEIGFMGGSGSTASEILHLRGLSTDGYVGRSVLQDASEMIGGALGTQEHSNALWSRDATPSIVLTHPKTLSEKAAKKLEESWEKTYGQGKDKKRIAVLEESMKMERLSITPNDGQFLETRRFQRGEIAGWFHVPPFMIGETEKSTSWGTGIEQQQIGFLIFTLKPDLVTWEQRLTRDLIVNPEKFFLEWNVEGFMRGDSAAQSNYFWKMVQMGAMSPNDVRALLNMNPIDGGDVYLQPMNMVPLGTVPASATVPGAPAPADEEGKLEALREELKTWIQAEIDRRAA